MIFELFWVGVGTSIFFPVNPRDARLTTDSFMSDRRGSLVKESPHHMRGYDAYDRRDS